MSKGKNGIVIDINEQILLPIKYCDIPPGAKLAITLWMIDPEKLVKNGTS